MSEPRTGWPRGRTQWILGTILLLALGVLFGMVFGNVWLGIVLSAVISIGWLLAYESWRGRNSGVNDPDRGIEL
ncbi:hypothetical protein [Microbacterium lushaniae]|uniref:Uncharacterized protein n=1 Tax=Microbacterium lushaniae TaxID=2614639 RepID=A0A5J5JQN3_9MICO|nr:hypothetical protein [Microbacterium lushaniae]KAA9155875.1 hypothetical protein F6B41_09560 [Microbacterium lushaniae]KAA9157650.1 hypothetical protein F6B41_05040 [Microbacterium lushaniae]QEW04176.1 hypothetical protein F6J85_14495 [Microbacterium lushaniae]